MILEKERDRRRQKNNVKESSEVGDKQKVIKEQQKQITDLKNKIAVKKRELDSVYQYPLIREKKDEEKYLKKVFKDLKIEYDSIQNIINVQRKALSPLRNKQEEDLKSQLVNQ